MAFMQRATQSNVDVNRLTYAPRVIVATALVESTQNVALVAGNASVNRPTAGFGHASRSICRKVDVKGM